MKLDRVKALIVRLVKRSPLKFVYFDGYHRGYEEGYDTGYSEGVEDGFMGDVEEGT